MTFGLRTLPCSGTLMGIFFLDSRVERLYERHGSRFALLDRGAGSVDGEEIQFHA